MRSGELWVCCCSVLLQCAAEVCLPPPPSQPWSPGAAPHILGVVHVANAGTAMGIAVRRYGPPPPLGANAARRFESDVAEPDLTP